jgi:hypothetical protein
VLRSMSMKQYASPSSGASSRDLCPSLLTTKPQISSAVNVLNSEVDGPASHHRLAPIPSKNQRRSYPVQTLVGTLSRHRRGAVKWGAMLRFQAEGVFSAFSGSQRVEGWVVILSAG